MNTRFTIIALLAMIAMSGVAMIAMSGASADGYIEEGLAASDIAASLAGYRAVRTRHGDISIPNLSGVFHPRLVAGKAYAFSAACDVDCHDIDLRVYDERGNLVAEDLETDDNPIVEVAPRYTATFKVKVDIPRCNAFPCYYKVRSYQKNVTKF